MFLIYFSTALKKEEPNAASSTGASSIQTIVSSSSETSVGHCSDSDLSSTTSSSQDKKRKKGKGKKKRPKKARRETKTLQRGKKMITYLIFPVYSCYDLLNVEVSRLALPLRCDIICFIVGTDMAITVHALFCYQTYCYYSA